MESGLKACDHGSGVAEHRGLIEIGLLIAGPLDSVDRRAAKRATAQVKSFLERAQPKFRFEFLEAFRPELAGDAEVEPSVLLQQALEDRDARHWDFVFLLTAADLHGHYSPYCFAALSRPLDAAVFSLSLIDPRARGADVDDAVRVETVALRLSRLMLCATGHLTGLQGSDEPENLLFRPAEANDLDRMEQLTDEQLERQASALAEVADLRLEEGSGRRLGGIAFTLRAAWINRRAIAEAIVSAKPWQFPKRLSRLTIASVSTFAILFMTAEAWDLGLSQGGGRLAALVVVALLVTSSYVIVRQQLLIRRGRHRSEQTVVTSASALAIVFLGMFATWLVLVVIGVAAAELLFRPGLIASWATASHTPAKEIDFGETFQMSCFSASLGLLIGALGASFESQHYFRHVIFVDEEI